MPFATPVQEIAINMAFRSLGEVRYNRTFEEYDEIAGRLPPLKQLLYDVNVELADFREAFHGKLPEICRFKAGDKKIIFDPYPAAISYETLRAALTLTGFRIPRR